MTVAIQKAGHRELRDTPGTVDGLAPVQGRVRGLLAVRDANGTSFDVDGLPIPPDQGAYDPTTDDVKYLYLYDANGNVGDLVDSATGSPTVGGTPIAHYEYDPYGNAVVASGDYAAANAFRFSTKFFDAETGQYYYGYRLLDPPLGRWISQDPAAEKGGLALYSFAANDALNRVDCLGLFTSPWHKRITRQAIMRISCAMARADQEWMILGNTDTDILFLSDYRYHAQSADFAELLHDLLQEIALCDCCRFPRGDSGVCLLRIGRALHIVQDFYSHTDWVEGGIPQMLDVYAYNGDHYLRPLAAGHVAHGATNTLSIDRIATGDYSEASQLLYYTGGYDWVMEISLHNNYAADEPGFGRSQDQPDGLGLGAFERTRIAAEKASAEFLQWAFRHMKSSCHRVLCK